MSTPTRVGRIETSFALLLITLCGFAASLSGCNSGAAQPRREIAFINFDNERARFAFDRFAAACEALGIQERHRVTLEFSGVDITDEVALRKVLQREINEGPVAIVAPTSPVLVEGARLTSTIPIVFFTHQDPVDLRLAASLTQRPRIRPHRPGPSASPSR